MEVMPCGVDFKHCQHFQDLNVHSEDTGSGPTGRWRGVGTCVGRSGDADWKWEFLMLLKPQLQPCMNAHVFISQIPWSKHKSGDSFDPFLSLSSLQHVMGSRRAASVELVVGKRSTVYGFVRNWRYRPRGQTGKLSQGMTAIVMDSTTSVAHWDPQTFPPNGFHSPRMGNRCSNGNV